MGALFVVILIFIAVVVAIVFFKSAKNAGNERYADEKRMGGKIALIVAAAFLFLFFLLGISVVPAGHVGVKDMFGDVDDMTLKPGVNYVSPFYDIEKMSYKTQEVKESMEVPSQEGLNVGMDVSLLFHLDPDKANEIYKTVGPEYTEIIVKPQFRSVVREVTARFEAKALYSASRDSLTTLIAQQLSLVIGPRGIIVENTPMRDLNLPRQLTDAIEKKLKAEQESEQMKFILTKEEQEAERKRVEAKGIADFQRIVTQGISQPLLQWKGIEATMELAKSNNSKIVVIGSGKDGLPIILNGQ